MRTSIPVRLPDELIAWIDEQAKATGEPRSVVLRQLLREQMHRQQRSRKRPAAQAQTHSQEQPTISQ